MIHVFSQTEAEVFIPKRETIAIRCLTPPKGFSLLENPIDETQEFPRLNHKLYLDVLNLFFDDVDPSRKGNNLRGYVLFNDRHAKKIADFVTKNFEKFEDVMVHCSAGISRSCAVGAALGDFYRWQYDPEILNRQEDGPNSLVYSTLFFYLQDRQRAELTR